MQKDMCGGGGKKDFCNERFGFLHFGFYISGKSMRLYKFLMRLDDHNFEKIKLVISDAKIDTKLRDILDDKKICYIEKDFCEFPEGTQGQKNQMFSDFMLDALIDNKVDYVFSFGSHILSGELLQKYKYRMINFHPSILPMFPGKYAIDRAAACENIFLLGNTAHFIDEGVDSGKIIMQSIIPVQAFLETGYDIVLDMQVEMLEKLIFLIENDRLRLVDDRVNILGADYQYGMVFPRIEG